MFPEVCRAILGRQPQGRPATLSDYAARQFKDDVYPGLVPRPGVVTPGIVYDDVLPHEWSALDDFEGPEYERWGVSASVAGHPVMVEAYVVGPHYRELLTAELWQRDVFVERRLANYVRKLNW